MTDDRARRIRDLRKRTAGGGDDDDDRTDADDGGSSESTADDPVKADGNGEEPSTPGDEREAASESADEADGADDGDSSSDSETPDGTATSDETADEAASDDEASGTEGGDDALDTEDSSDATTDDAADEGSSGPAPTDADDRESEDASADSESAETTVAAAAQTAAVASSAADVGAEQGLKPMVEPADASDSPFGGAIANEDVLADFVDDVGTGETDAVAASGQRLGDTAGRGASVFDRDDSLVATTHDDDTIQMLEFYLNDDRYAIEIERISAIVEMKRITRFPRGPEAIDGVTDLRGEITAVLDPTTMLDVERSELTDDQYIVVLERDDDKQKLGIRVTDVLQAVTYRESQIDETASVMDAAGDHQHEFVNGIVKKTTDGRTELVTWLDVDSIIENTE